MSLYNYTARSAGGEEKKGQMEAKDEFELARILRQDNIFLISGKLAEEPSKAKDVLGQITGFLKFFKFRRGVPLAEKMIFSRNLSVMVGAGLSLSRAIETLAKQTPNKKLKSILISINSEIQKGRPFSDSLEMHIETFGDLYVNMIRSAESSGNMEDILKLLAKQLKKEYDLKRKVKGAFTYPAVILVAMSIIGAIMMFFVVPILATTFKELGVQLPLTTRIMIAVAEFGANYWYFFFAIIAAIIYGLVLFFRTKIGKNTSDTIFLKMPLIGSLTKKINSARFARTMSSLLEGGVPIIKSLEIVSKAIPNHYYVESIKVAIGEVQKGRPLSQTLEKYPNLYPPLVVQMIAVGEETGSVSDILKRLAMFFESEVSENTKNMSTIIEPFLMIIIGIIVGFFAISMMQPMYSVVGAI